MNRKLMCCNGNSQLGSSVDHLESTLKKIKEFAKRLDEDERRKFDRRVPDLDQMTSELERAAHAEWRVLLRKVAGHRPEKVDYILDRLIRGWSPSTPHRFVAFLARALGWKLILTTNFDTLIEQASARTAWSRLFMRSGPAATCPTRNSSKRTYRSSSCTAAPTA